MFKFCQEAIMSTQPLKQLNKNQILISHWKYKASETVHFSCSLIVHVFHVFKD